MCLERILIEQYASKRMFRIRMKKIILKCFRNGMMVSYKTTHTFQRLLGKKIEKLGIYEINCNDYNATYVGQTRRPIRIMHTKDTGYQKSPRSYNLYCRRTVL